LKIFCTHLNFHPSSVLYADKTKPDWKKQSTGNTTKKTRSNQKKTIHQRPEQKLPDRTEKKLDDLDRSRKAMCIIKKKDQPCVLLEEKPYQTEKNE
jgi:DNA-directed RNA polymerase beta subunit